MGAILDRAGTVAADASARMVAELRHRGPDGDAVRRSGPATLVHTRLAIVDVAGGDQPLCSEDGQVAVVVNGEIYNHLELRAELEERGHRFATRSDSEVVVHLYEEHGIEGFRRLNGIYGFALWDDRRGRLVAARDPFGVKPVYWCGDGRRLALASEVTALLAAGVAGGVDVDPVALDHYLALRFVPSPRTLFAGVSKLPPASVLVAQDGELRVESLRTAPAAALPDASAEELRERLLAAVQRQMMSDVPYGAFLSGGVDSAAVVAAMARGAAGPPTTFTIGFPGAGVYDERDEAEATARALGADHHATAQEAGDVLGDLELAVRRLEEPLGIPSAPALMQLSAFAARSVKVVLSGQGADEPHGGYDRHQAALLLRWLGGVPAGLARPAAGLAGRLPRLERAGQIAALVGAKGAEGQLALVEYTSADLRARLGGEGAVAAAERRALVDAVSGDVGDRPALDRALYLDAHLFLPDRLLICGDKMSMAHALELRVPYLDLELMRWVERVPARLRAGLRAKKRLHRAAIAPLVPAETLDRPRHGFATPLDDWLRSSLAGEVHRRWREDAALDDLARGYVVERLVEDHLARRADHKRLLYALLELAVWHRAFVQGASEPEGAAAAAARA